MKSVLLTFLLLCTLTIPTMAYEQAFAPTKSGETEVKVLPAGVLLRKSGQGNYFDQADGLFMPLFRYIQRHKIAMTVPVEARIESAEMFFWVAESELAKVGGNEDGVMVERLPERRVASLATRGSYSRKNFETARARLIAWVRAQPQLEITGEAYAVYWNGPFTPWFMRRSEVHVPVRAKSAP